MTAMFVTGAGTGVGKTFVASGLIRELRGRGRSVEAMKPVITGFDTSQVHESDTARLLAALGRPLTADHIAAVSRWRLRAPVAPDLAARLEGGAIDFTDLTALCRDAIDHYQDALIIEGIGGVMVPLDDRHTVLDWMIEVNLPLLVVAGSYVGTLSHTLTALDVLRRNRLTIAGVVVSETPHSATSLEETVATIRRFAARAEVFALPRLPEAQIDHPVMAAIADLM